MSNKIRIEIEFYSQSEYVLRKRIWKDVLNELQSEGAWYEWDDIYEQLVIIAPIYQFRSINPGINGVSFEFSEYEEIFVHKDVGTVCITPVEGEDE